MEYKRGPENMESVTKGLVEGSTHRINKMEQRLPSEYYIDIKRNQSICPKI